MPPRRIASPPSTATATANTAATSTSNFGNSMENEMENSDGNSIRNDEENEKEQVEGAGSDSRVGNEIIAMEVEQDMLDAMDKQLRTLADAAGVERTPEMQAGSEATPQTTEKVEIPQFAAIETGKQFVLPDARARSRRDQVSGLTATKAAAMRTECKRVQAVSYQVRAETADGLQALREKIKTSGGGAVGGRHLHGVGMCDSYA